MGCAQPISSAIPMFAAQNHSRKHGFFEGAPLATPPGALFRPPADGFRPPRARPPPWAGYTFGQPAARQEPAMPDPMLIARHGDIECFLLPALCNRHGLITGATGTGKTVTLQVMAERVAALGVPVFMADVKGDLAGLSQPGATSAKFAERLELIGVPAPDFAGSPTVFWDMYGEQGHPIRATISDLG